MQSCQTLFLPRHLAKCYPCHDSIPIINYPPAIETCILQHHALVLPSSRIHVQSPLGHTILVYNKSPNVRITSLVNIIQSARSSLLTYFWFCFVPWFPQLSLILPLSLDISLTRTISIGTLGQNQIKFAGGTKWVHQVAQKLLSSGPVVTTLQLESKSQVTVIQLII